MVIDTDIVLKKFSLFFQNVPCFESLTIDFKAGSFTALLGKSGVGKSSLLNAIAGLYIDQDGVIQILS